MNPTPERALELAEYLSESSNAAILAGGSKAMEITKALRAYADLSQKWQSVLDAEVVGEIRPNLYGERIVAYSIFAVDAIPLGTQLIIKPAP